MLPSLKLYACCVAVWACLAGPTWSETDDQMPDVSISSVPRGEPDPPLRYMFVPNHADLVPGNAAIYYYRAILSMPKNREAEFGETQLQWQSMPPKAFPVGLVKEWLNPWTDTLAEVKTAAYRSQCDWDMNTQTIIQFFNFRLPELSSMRQIARVLRLKAQLEIAEGDFDSARETILIGYRMAGHLSESPLVIHQMVATAIAMLVNESVTEWIQAGGPNLFWGLASLPEPIVDIRKAVQLETAGKLGLVPFLQNPETLHYTPQRWRQEFADLLRQFGTINGPQGASVDVMAQTVASAMIVAAYPAAKAELIKSGMDAEKVEQMPVGQVVAIQTSRSLRKVIDETTKWTLLPYWQSYRQMSKSVRELHEQGHLSAGGAPGAVPVAGMIFVATEGAALAPVRLQREIAALQTIEAIRMSTAEQNGQLPKSLAELENSPAPMDPVTGAPFVYSVEDGRAVLVLPPPEGREAQRFGKRYVITLKTEDGRLKTED